MARTLEQDLALAAVCGFPDAFPVDVTDEFEHVFEPVDVDGCLWLWIAPPVKGADQAGIGRHIDS